MGAGEGASASRSRGPRLLRPSWDLLRTICARRASCSRDFILQESGRVGLGRAQWVPGGSVGGRASPGSPPQCPLLGLQGTALCRGQGLLGCGQLRALHTQPLLMASLSFGCPHRGAASHVGQRGRGAEPGPGDRKGGPGRWGTSGRSLPGETPDASPSPPHPVPGPGPAQGGSSSGSSSSGGSSLCGARPAAAASCSICALFCCSFRAGGRGEEVRGSGSASDLGAGQPADPPPAHLPPPASYEGHQHPPVTRALGGPQSGARAPPTQSTSAAHGKTAAPVRP